MSEEASKKMEKICEELDILVPKIEKSLFPDVKKWREWTPKDFRKFVFFDKFGSWVQNKCKK